LSRRRAPRTLRGAGEFCIVVAVRGPSEKLLERVCAAVEEIKAELPLTVAVSLGILTTARSSGSPKPASIRSIITLKPRAAISPGLHHAQLRRALGDLSAREAAPLELCCGGIIGMGEDVADRLDFLSALQELQPQEVPINFLNPRPGTPFGERSLLDPVEALRFVAMARLALPKRARALCRRARELRCRRCRMSACEAASAASFSATILTTEGRSDADDFAMLNRLGFEVLA
jgi:biotin synthase